MRTSDDPPDEGGQPRELWEIPTPPGGWFKPWPQCAELARSIPSEQWTLVGGLMVQLHGIRAGLQIMRPTHDVDLLLHIETGAVSMPAMHRALDGLGYVLRPSLDDTAPAHRFVRDGEQLDVMVADHLAPRLVPRLAGRRVVQAPGGTQALRRTVKCHLRVDGEDVWLSVPNLLGALVLKGAAYRSDTRERERHLDDAVLLAATISRPRQLQLQLRGSDRKRIISLLGELSNPNHKSWLTIPQQLRLPALESLRRLAANPNTPPASRLGR